MLLSKNEVCTLVGYSDEHIRRLMNAGRFPKCILVNPDASWARGRKAWSRQEVEAWVAERLAARDEARK